jgi:hypothetical protein
MRHGNMRQSYKGHPVVKSYRTANVEVLFVEMPEDTDPIDTVAWSPEEDAEYAQKVYDGTYPWYCLGVFVLFGGHEVGSSYLGCIDTWNLRDINAFDVAREALEQARITIAHLRGSLSTVKA